MKIYRQSSSVENAVSAAINLVKLLNVNITETSIKGIFAKQLEPNSLVAIMNSLAEFGVSTIAVNAKLEHLEKEVTYPCIAHFTINSGAFIVISSVIDNMVTYIDAINGWKTESIGSFSSKWAGILLIPELNVNADEFNFKEKRRIEKTNKFVYPFIIVLSAILIFLVIFNVFLDANPPLVWYILFFINLIGGLISLVLIQSKYFAKHSIFCPTNTKVNCSQVVNSKMARIFPWLDLTDLCVLFFFGNLVALFLGSLSSNETEIIWIISMFSFLTIPICIFSIIGQKFTLKKWCMLCLFIVFALLCNFFVGIYFKTYGYGSKIEVNEVITFSLSFIFTTVIWFGMRAILPAINKTKQLQAKLDNIIRTPNLISLIFEQFPKINKLENTEFIEIGNRNGKLKIRVFISPTCPTCALVYPIIAKWIKDSRISVEILICLNKNAETIAFEFAKSIISFNKSNDIKKVIGGLAYWFELYQNDQSNKWFQRYIANEDEMNYAEIINNNFQMLDKSGITLLPTFVIDNCIFPKEYDFEILESVIRYKLQT